MRALFSSVPGHGHLLPILPLARAARAAGADVLVATHADLGGAVGSLPFRGVGPSVPELLEETARRYGSRGTDLAEGAEVGLFTDSRVALTHQALLAVAREFAPDVIVADEWDYVAPLVASSLGVPWVAHGITRAMPAPLLAAMADGLGKRATELGVHLGDRAALVTIWPEWLQGEDFVPPPDTLTMQPSVHTSETGEAFTAQFPGRQDRPLVLFTLGTVVRDVGLLTRSVRGLCALDVNVIVTVPDGTDADSLDLPVDRVVTTGFVPLAQLLPGVSVVVSAGGAGTVLAALSRGLPMALLPLLADQPAIAAAVAGVGAGIVCDAADQLPGAVQRLLTDARSRDAAQTAAERLSSAHTAPQVWAQLSERVRSRPTAGAARREA